MPNRASQAGHIPQRTCVICRAKRSQPELFRFIVLKGRYIIDPQRRLPGRGYYCCPALSCLEGLEKWLKRLQKKRRLRG